MRNIFLLLIVLGLTCNTASAAAPLQVGDTASDWSFKDSADKVFTMATWPNKVLLINYVDPDEADVNEPFNDAMRTARKAGLLLNTEYMGLGIVDCKATWKPDMLIRTIAGNKAEKYKRTILFDYDAELRTSWGLKEDSSNVILLDKNHVVKYISRGKMNTDQIESVVQMAIDLQK
jgi:predicted transcriptional regulator